MNNEHGIVKNPRSKDGALGKHPKDVYGALLSTNSKY